MNENDGTNQTNNQEYQGRESKMQPLTPDSTRQPLHTKTLSEMQQSDEMGLLEDVDETVQQNDNVAEPHVVDRQIGIVNRPAG